MYALHNTINQLSVNIDIGIGTVYEALAEGWNGDISIQTQLKEP